MTHRGWSVTLVGMTAAALATFALSPASAERFRNPAPVRAEPRVTAQEKRVHDARSAFERNQMDVARELLKGIDPAQLPRDLGEEAAFLSASLAEDATTSDRLFDEYLKNYPRGAFRRALFQ